MIEVYARRANSPEAAAFVKKQRSEGKNARETNARYFDPEQADLTVERVYHDGEVPAIPYFYGQKDIPCEIIPGFRGEVRHEAPDEAPEDVRDGYHVEQSGPWYALMGPDGEKIGKSQRSAEEAWAQLEEDGD